MFILYAVAVGLAVGLMTGGSLERLSHVRLRWPGVAHAGLAVQLVLFSGPVTDAIGDAGPPIYVASTLAVLGFVMLNVHLPGLFVVAAGALTNLVAIISNGGFMPAADAALALAGFAPTEGAYSNSRQFAQPSFPALSDIFAIPEEVPFSNIYSIGDVLIGVGLAVILVWAMRGGEAPARVPAGAR